MSVVHPALLYGLGLAAIPVVLHFLMRVKPRKLAFPALLLIRSRRKTNSRRLRLRHVWLLLLRVSVIVLLVVAVARPSLPAANYALSLREALTLAAIVVALLAVYRALLRYWRQARLLGNEFVWRRTLARNATGILGLLLCLMFVVWPWQQRVAAEMSGPKAELLASLPVAAVFVFDASGSMNYLFESRTRHEAAKEIAIEQLGKLPSGSRVAVTDTVPGRNVVFQADLPVARTRIQGLGVSPVAENLDRQVMSAIRFQQDDRKRILDEQGLSNESEAGDQYVREIYVLADMARSAWDLESSAHLRQDMEASPWLHVYLIDVGVPFPTNVAISGMRLSSQSIPRGSELVVDATVQITGLPPGNRSVELWLPGPDGALINRGGAEVHVDANANSRVDFTLAGLTDSLVQGELRLDPIDPFRDDDVVHFTVVLHEPAPVLLVGDSLDSTAFLHDALAPIEFEQQNRAAWNCTAITDDQLPGFDPDRFEIVCLINVSSLTDLEWDRLAGFVRNGGGLATFIGRAGGDLDAVSWASEAALAVLPAELLGAVRFSPEPAFLSVRDSAHPLFRDLTQSADGIAELAKVRFSRCWSVAAEPDATVLAEFRGNRRLPALLDRIVGDGRCLMLTSAVDNLPDGGREWNSFATSWSFVVLANQMMEYLTGQSNDQFNFVAGQDVVLRIDADAPAGSWRIRKPLLQNTPREIRPRQTIVTIQDADQVGHYQFVSGDDSISYQTGFSVNPRAEESDFTVLTDAELDSLFGKNRYSRAKTMEDLTRMTGDVRIGREVFPFVIVVVCLLFCAEHFVANRFYETGPTG